MKPRGKINREGIAGGLHITFCIKVRFNLALITNPRDDSLEPLSLVNPGKKQSLTETKGFRLFLFSSALCFGFFLFLDSQCPTSHCLWQSVNMKIFRIITQNLISCFKGYHCTFFFLFFYEQFVH